VESMNSLWKTFRDVQMLKRDLRIVARIEPDPAVLSRIQAQVETGELPRQSPRSTWKVAALAVALSTLTLVAGAATLYPQTPEGAQQWLEQRWVEQTKFGTTGGGHNGVSDSPMGVSGFEESGALTWNTHGVAQVTLRDKTGLLARVQTRSMAQDLELKVARLMSPALATALHQFQETYRDRPMTTFTLEGRSISYPGFGHFEVKDTQGEVRFVADVVPLK
jgi:hypothetical protein